MPNICRCWSTETLRGLSLKPGAWVIDCTLGGGGHTATILERTAPDGRVLGLDADPAAIQRVSGRLANELEKGRLVLAQRSFEHLETIAADQGFVPVDGILLDLGTSSFQLETAERGFSFNLGGPLDMRFDPNEPVSAADIVNDTDEKIVGGSHLPLRRRRSEPPNCPISGEESTVHDDDRACDGN